MMQSKLVSEYLQKTRNIDQIAKEAIEAQERRLPQKYANIETSLKILSNLIFQFKKKADNYEKDLKNRAKIDDFTQQIIFHKTRIAECQVLAEKTNEKIKLKRQIIIGQQLKVTRLRKQIIGLKTQNVKKIIKIEEIHKLAQNKTEKQNTQTKKLAIKSKKQNDRDMIVNGKTRYVSQDLVKTKENLSNELFNKIQSKIYLKKFLNDAFEILKQKLTQHERKSNPYGLNGSLIFKIVKNNVNTSFQKPIKDPKLMIYDVLKQKHANHLKNEKQNSEQVYISEDEFLQFNYLQIMGIIELKGGYKKLLQKVQKCGSSFNFNKNAKILEDTCYETKV